MKRLLRYALMSVMLLVPSVAIQGYVITRPEPEPFSEFEARVNYVIMTLAGTEASDLADPSLLALRSQLIGLANQVAGERIFRKIVFSGYSVVKQ